MDEERLEQLAKDIADHYVLDLYSIDDGPVLFEAVRAAIERGYQEAKPPQDTDLDIYKSLLF